MELDLQDLALTNLTRLGTPRLNAIVGQLPVQSIPLAKLRRDFRETAAWLPQIRTDDRGRAHAELRKTVEPLEDDRYLEPDLRAAFIGSLVFAVFLDTERLMFLVIILPVIVLFFAVFGVLGRWVGLRSAALPVGLSLGVVLAWSLASTFPVFEP